MARFPCTFALGCDHPVHAYNLCAGHDRQRRLGKVLAPLRSLRPRPRKVHPPTPCSFPFCPFNAWEDGLCVGHYKQRQHGRVLRPLRPRRKPGAPRPKCSARICGNRAEGNDTLCRKCRARIDRLGRDPSPEAILAALSRPTRRILWLHRKRASAA